MRRTFDGEMLDSLLLWMVVAFATLFGYLMWGALIVQDHYYFYTTPVTFEGVRIPQEVTSFWRLMFGH